MKSLDSDMSNPVRNTIASIRELFPHCIVESRDESGEILFTVDFDLLRQELSDTLVEGPSERYRLDWPGKREAILAANSSITKVLRPCCEESLHFNTTRNLFIEGDNLDALKLLLESSLSSIDLIYIDPPYNTGEDFIYQDDFRKTAEVHHVATRQKDAAGKRLASRLESGGRFHSAWLSMMYARLKVARKLLSKQGVIFISIDDEEQDNLKKICDEIFGQENFLNTISVTMKNIAGASGGGEDKRLKKNIEYLHIYVRSRADFPGLVNAFDFVPVGEMVEQYRVAGKSWKYTSVLVEPGTKVRLGVTADGEGNDIVVFARQDFVIRTVVQIMADEGISESEAYRKYASKIFQTTMPQSSIRPRVIAFLKENGGICSELHSIEYIPRSGRNKGRVYEQFYKGDNFRLFAWLKDVTEECDGILYKKEMKGTYWDFAGETKNLTKEGNVLFPNGKKPVSMLQRIVQMQPRRDCTVLDFFAGSSSMAHAVMSANADDGGNRRFIMVQLPEPVDAAQFGFETISDLSKERIRRAGAAILSGCCHEGWRQDTGFRVFRIDSSNLVDRACTPDSVSREHLLKSIENIKSDRTACDLLFQAVLCCGLDLSLPLSEEGIAGKRVFCVGEGELVACFETGMDTSLAKALERYKPKRVVFRNDGFPSDAVTIAVEKALAESAPDCTVMIL